MFFTKYILSAEKKYFCKKQTFYAEKKTITEKKNFQKKTFYTENKCVTNEKIYLF